MRLIDADALKEAIEDNDNFVGGSYDIIKVVDAQPTVIPAQPEIIRCKDCKHYDAVYTFDKGVCGHWHSRANAYDFCSKAEKKEVTE